MPAKDMARRKACLFLRALQRAMQKTADMIIEVASTGADIGFQVPDIVMRVIVQDADRSAHIKAARILPPVNRSSTRCPAP